MIESLDHAETRRREHSVSFREHLERIGLDGKINGLMQAQVIALQVANDTKAGTIGRTVAHEIASKIAADVRRLQFARERVGNLQKETSDG